MVLKRLKFSEPLPKLILSVEKNLTNEDKEWHEKFLSNEEMHKNY